MGLGEAIKRDFKVIKNNPNPTVVDLGFTAINDDCCFNINVLAQIGGTDPFKNDRKGFINFFDNGFTGGQMGLQKFEGGAWVTKIYLVDNNFGTFYPYGFETNGKGEKLLGYLLEWKLVLAAYGEGKYRVSTMADTIFETEVERLSFEFCLKTYRDYLADKTVRIDFWSAGITGDSSDDRKTKDYGNITWFDQIRLPDSIFWKNDGESERKFTRYQTGKQVWNQDNQSVKFTLNTGRFPFYLHEYLMCDMFQADEISITDYNSNNPTPHIDKYVVPDSNYQVPWIVDTMLAPVELQFKQLFENRRKKRC